ncbi:hypothetical protein E4K67_22370 [Desulfosporosinus fructosivorans]|uniref:Tail fiber protein n=1 Tax=Desulfosporosinus fructosivorans TaxID=2018669 RepID=A0A4Z0R2J1_9FIRM|nr:hypothetical protein [Desulfosporosinus fructosivorans]TGE35866.1 hypothetical protein E4K67_22370 [Desulfosporosinus fructosivorans]
MPGNSNFKVFNENFLDAQTDGDYLAETQRVNGLTAGIAKTKMHNKLFRQTSIMVAAIAQVMANQGAVVSDGDLAALVSVIQSSFETPVGAQNKVNVHASKTDNPHVVTASQTGAIPAAQKGAAGGVGTLDAYGNPVQKSYVTGTYTGNGASSRSIPLGFAPSAVYVCSQRGGAGDNNYWSASYEGGLALPGSPVRSGVTQSYPNGGSVLTPCNDLLVNINGNSFYVYYNEEDTSSGSSNSWWNYMATNRSGTVYNYIAFK